MFDCTIMLNVTRDLFYIANIKHKLISTQLIIHTLHEPKTCKKNSCIFLTARVLVKLIRVQNQGKKFKVFRSKWLTLSFDCLPLILKITSMISIFSYCPLIIWSFWFSTEQQKDTFHYLFTVSFTTLINQ